MMDFLGNNSNSIVACLFIIGVLVWIYIFYVLAHEEDPHS